VHSKIVFGASTITSFNVNSAKQSHPLGLSSQLVLSLLVRPAPDNKRLALSQYEKSDWYYTYFLNKQYPLNTSVGMAFIARWDGF
jgi:hypothetical protein